MEIKKHGDSTNKKNEFAFSAIMFFAPLIKNNVKIDKNLSIEEKSFINGYIKLGYFNIILLIICIIIGIISFRTNNPTFEKINVGLLITLSISLIIGTLLVALNKNINGNKDLKNLESKNDFEKLLYFIPIYNIYIRYNNHQFEGENSTIKSGIALWAIFTLSSIFVFNVHINIILLVLICFKITYTICGINFGTNRNNKLNGLFKKNPEELRGYLTGTLITPFNKKGLKNNINNQKEHFEYLFKLDNKQIICEYILLLLLSVLGICTAIVNNIYFLLIGNIFIIIRYFIMIIKWEHVPHLPIFRGITNIFFKSNKTKNE